MNVWTFVPGWVKDLHRRKRDTRDVEIALRDHSETLRGLTVMLKQEVDNLKGEVGTR